MHAKAADPPELNVDCNLERFEEWRTPWKTYAKLSDLNECTQVDKVSVVQSYLTLDLQAHVRHNVKMEFDGTKSRKEILNAIGERRSIVLDRLKFEERRQEPDENFVKGK